MILISRWFVIYSFKNLLQFRTAVCLWGEYFHSDSIFLLAMLPCCMHTYSFPQLLPNFCCKSELTESFSKGTWEGLMDKVVKAKINFVLLYSQRKLHYTCMLLFISSFAGGPLDCLPSFYLISSHFLMMVSKVRNT